MHITLINIYMDNRYNYGIMTQDHDPHPRYTDVDERRTPYRR